MNPASWTPTGWKCATGHIIEVSLHLPAGVTARVHRHDKGFWQYTIQRGYPQKMAGSFKHRSGAMRACEAALSVELKSALRMFARSKAMAT